MEIEWLAPEEIDPPHEVRDEAKVAALVQSMRDAPEGWVGRPLVIMGSSGSYVALTGSHRLAAALEVMETIPCVVLTEEQFAVIPNTGHINVDYVVDKLRDSGHAELADLIAEG